MKASRPIAAGQRPSRSGYGGAARGRGTARAPIARHGLKRRKTSPNSTLANTSPTQKMMKTKVGAKLSSGVGGPA